VIERERKVKGRIERQQIAIDQSHKFTRRIFSRNNWKMNGRWYGGFWQNLSKAERRHIQIDAEPTDEIDYSGLHPALLALQNGVQLTTDPYDLGYQVTRSIPLAEQRKVVKLLVLVAINAKNMDAAIRAFQKGNGGYKKKDLIAVLEAFKSKHPYLADSLCADRGIHLMYLDSMITAQIINEFVALGKPILPIHDSYIVKIDDRDLLRAAMRRASLAVVGADLEAVSKFDESIGFTTLDGKATELQAEMATDEIIYRSWEGCDEYLQRYKAWFTVMHPQEQFLPYQIGGRFVEENTESRF
jgi:hypothetical protein